MSILPTSAKDLLTCIAFSPSTPTHLATSSLDGFVRIYSRDKADGAWAERGKWKAHEGPVLKVCWASRMWTGVLATAGAEGGVRIWERLEADPRRPPNSNGNDTATTVATTGKNTSSSGNSGGFIEWSERANLVESRAPIRDMAFAPCSASSSPLILATLSADSILRVYTLGPTSTAVGSSTSSSAASPSSALSNWILSNQVDLNRLPNGPVAGTNTATTTAGLSQQQQQQQQHSSGIGGVNSALGYGGGYGIGTGSGSFDFSGSDENNSTMGAGVGTGVASAGAGSSGAATATTGGATTGANSTDFSSPLAGWSLGWCKEVSYGLILAVSCGTQGVVRLLRIESPGDPTQQLVLQAQPSTSSVSAPGGKSPVIGIGANSSGTFGASGGAGGIGSGGSGSLGGVGLGGGGGGTSNSNFGGVGVGGSSSGLGSGTANSSFASGMGSGNAVGSSNNNRGNSGEFGSPWSIDGGASGAGANQFSASPPTGHGNLFPSKTSLANTSSSSSNIAGLSSQQSGGQQQPLQGFAGIVSLDWAPPQGRSFQLIATASRDDHIRIWKVWPPNTFGGGTNALNSIINGEQNQQQSQQWRAQLAADLEHAGSGLGKVEWNITGTVLASSADDGCTKLWKSTFSGEWKCVAVVSGEGNDGVDS